MSDEIQREPWEKLPSAIDPERARRADEKLAGIRADMASGKVLDVSEQRGAPVEISLETIREALKEWGENREARDKLRESEEYDEEYEMFKNYCSV